MNTIEGTVGQIVEDVVLVAAVSAALGLIWAAATINSRPRFRKTKR